MAEQSVCVATNYVSGFRVPAGTGIFLFAAIFTPAPASTQPRARLSNGDYLFCGKVIVYL
jgi:hypothetical protein